MKVVNDLNKISNRFKNAVVTIGNFDGVHVGHQALFRRAIKMAHRLKGTSVAITFEPHPLRVLHCNKHFPLLTPYEQTVKLIEATGVDILVCLPFTREFSVTPARTFVKEVLCDTIGMKAVIEGPDYSFGKNIEGNVSLLKEMGRVYSFEVIILGWVELGTQRISSTEIRNLVREGAVDQAAKLLGHNYQVRGTIVHGRHRGGNLLGFPTMNLKFYDELCPKDGVYAVTVEYNGMSYKGVVNIGYSPTFDNGGFNVEVHPLDFEQEAYDQTVRVNFVRRLRGEIKFPKPEALALQITQDIKEAMEVLSHHV
jgi:riboflavin kinase/FMN adenylyltransferase